MELNNLRILKNLYRAEVNLTLKELVTEALAGTDFIGVLICDNGMGREFLILDKDRKELSMSNILQEHPVLVHKLSQISEICREFKKEGYITI